MNMVFSQGVEGLEKMVRRSTEIRMSLSETFKVADKVFSPEGAMETIRRVGCFRCCVWRL